MKMIKKSLKETEENKIKLGIKNNQTTCFCSSLKDRKENRINDRNLLLNARDETPMKEIIGTMLQKYEAKYILLLLMPSEVKRSNGSKDPDFNLLISSTYLN
jgi:hypothetical protein